jgi:hypothetical protein
MNSTTCPICLAHNVSDINAEIIAGRGLAMIARTYSFRYHVMYYHAQNHVAKDPKFQNIELQNNTLSDLEINKGLLEKLLQTSIEKNQTQNALKIVIELRALSEMYLRVSSNGLQSRIKELETEISLLKSGVGNTRPIAEDDYSARLKLLPTSDLEHLERIHKKMFPEGYAQSPRAGFDNSN